jgi:hypothetical protein
VRANPLNRNRIVDFSLSIKQMSHSSPDNLASAQRKLISCGIFELPNTRETNDWSLIQSTANLNVPELIALKNNHFPSSQNQGKFHFLIFIHLLATSNLLDLLLTISALSTVASVVTRHCASR